MVLTSKYEKMCTIIIESKLYMKDEDIHWTLLDCDNETAEQIEFDRCAYHIISYFLNSVYGFVNIVVVVVVCLPSTMEGMVSLQFSDLFTELPVPPQTVVTRAGVVGRFNVLLYIILSTTVSYF